MPYTDLFIDFDDTIYDTHGNAVIALGELYVHFGLDRYFRSVEEFTLPYWEANVELWDLYSRGLIDREYLIIERFRRPLSRGIVPMEGSGQAEGNGQAEDNGQAESCAVPMEDNCHVEDNGHAEDSAVQHFNPTREYCLEVSDYFLELCASKPGVVEGAHEAMRYLKERGYRLHICSNGFHEIQYRKLRASNLEQYFDSVILSEDAGANKPQKQYFDYAFAQTGAQPSTTLMIGDNFQSDILGAKAAGIDQLFFNRHPDTFTPTEPVTYQIRSLSELRQLL